eukprot:9143730-Lingulodinium_polyedra.AAC.1
MRSLRFPRNSRNSARPVLLNFFARVSLLSWVVVMVGCVVVLVVGPLGSWRCYRVELDECQ